MIEPLIPAANSKVILIVDDDSTMRGMTQLALHQSGFNVVTASDGGEALEKVAQQKIDCIVTDIVMPKMNGIELCSMIRVLPGGNRIQILIMTGLDDLESIQKACAAGANDFASKGFHPSLLVERVRYLLRNQDLQDTLHQSEQRLNYAERLASVGHWERTINGTTQAISPTVCKFLDNKNISEITWDYLCDHTHPDDVPYLKANMEHAIKNFSNFQLEHRYISNKGALRILRHQGEFNRDANGNWVIYSTVQDVTENRVQEERIRFLAFKDPLTELPNRAAAIRDLARLLDYHKDDNSLVAVLAICLDDFNRITGSLGQDASDTVLKAVSDILRKQIRDPLQDLTNNDDPKEALLIAHSEGEKFICIVNHLKFTEAASAIAKRIQRAISAPIKVADMELQLTASIGISLCPNDTQDAHQLLDNAFTALLHACDHKNACQLFSDDLNHAARQRLSLEVELVRAMENQEFELFYQPRLNLSDNSIRGAEALVRWRHPQRGIIGPSEFILLLEEMGLISKVGNQVINMAAQQAALWQRTIDPDFRVSFNVSPLQFGLVDLVTEIDAAVKRTGAQHTNLEMEVTESALMSDPEQVISILRALRNRGLRIAMDDFGTGFSSLGMLRDMPVDILKIDRSFVKDIGVTATGSAMVNAILVMARALNLKCVAEGVEMDTQLHFLTHNHCNEAQGYLLAKPMTAQHLEHWIKQWRQEKINAA